MLLYIITIIIISIIILIYESNKRNLIYICFTGEKYLELAKLLIRSIDTFLTRNDVDILLVTNDETMKLCNNWLYKKWSPSNKNIKVIYSITDKPFYLHRFMINDIFKTYRKILYLDTDILISSPSINNIFDENLQENTLYVVQESLNHNGYEHSFKDKLYNTDEQVILKSRNIYPFNNGQFMFTYSSEMKNHFDNVINIIKSRKHDLFIDQQAMNVYFNNLFLTKSGIVDKYTKLFAKDYRIVYPMTKCIMHFCGDIHDGEKKKEYMLNFLEMNDIKLN
jgi:lipopolysaccharide biosynthesis glycosyltransferase